MEASPILLPHTRDGIRRAHVSYVLIYVFIYICSLDLWSRASAFASSHPLANVIIPWLLGHVIWLTMQTTAWVHDIQQALRRKEGLAA